MYMETKMDVMSQRMEGNGLLRRPGCEREKGCVVGLV